MRKKFKLSQSYANGHLKLASKGFVAAIQGGILEITKVEATEILATMIDELDSDTFMIRVEEILDNIRGEEDDAPTHTKKNRKARSRAAS